VRVSTADLPKRNITSAETSHDSDRAHEHDRKKRAVDNDCIPFDRNLTTNTTSTGHKGTLTAANGERTVNLFQPESIEIKGRNVEGWVGRRGCGGGDRKWAFSHAGQCVNTGVGIRARDERHQKRDSVSRRCESHTAKIFRNRPHQTWGPTQPPIQLVTGLSRG
jgi:hypothetical protein